MRKLGRVRFGNGDWNILVCVRDVVVEGEEGESMFEEFGWVGLEEAIVMRGFGY